VNAIRTICKFDIQISILASVMLFAQMKGEHRLCRIYKYKAMSVVACPPTPNGETNSVK
jgi:hypothetical protein